MDREKCRGCKYWRTLAADNVAWYACHHAIDTEILRNEVDGVCYSRVPKKRKTRKKKTEEKLQ